MSATNQAAPEIHTVEIPAHEFFRMEVRPPRNWGEWLELAREARTLDQKLGLLHGAFNVELGRHDEYDCEAHEYKPYTHTERLEFFFGVADGWNDISSLDLTPKGARVREQEKTYFVGFERNPHFVRELRRTESEQRQVLARKAFDMLCANFFKTRGNPGGGDGEGVRTLVSIELFPVIRNFFRIKNDFWGIGIRNLSGRADEFSHGEKHAVDFLLKLAEFLWGWQEESISSWECEERKTQKQTQNAAMRACIDSSKPWMVGVLARLGKFEVLEPYILELEAPCLARLKEIALSCEISTPAHPFESRKVMSVDEACYAGSPVAWFLKRCELERREHNRLEGIRDAERVMEESARKLEELAGQK
jgi:hypothetical protein